MALVVPNNSEVVMLRYILNIENPENLIMKLFVNDVVPNEGTTEASFVEASGNGYTEQNLLPGNWGIVAGDPSVAEHSELTWTFTGPLGLVYGYYVVRDASDDLLWAERFTNGPYNVQQNGDQIKITPRLTLE